MAVRRGAVPALRCRRVMSSASGQGRNADFSPTRGAGTKAMAGRRIETAREFRWSGWCLRLKVTAVVNPIGERPWLAASDRSRRRGFPDVHIERSVARSSVRCHLEGAAKYDRVRHTSPTHQPCGSRSGDSTVEGGFVAWLLPPATLAFAPVRRGVGSCAAATPRAQHQRYGCHGLRAKTRARGILMPAPAQTGE